MQLERSEFLGAGGALRNVQALHLEIPQVRQERGALTAIPRGEIAVWVGDLGQSRLPDRVQMHPKLFNRFGISQRSGGAF